MLVEPGCRRGLLRPRAGEALERRAVKGDGRELVELGAREGALRDLLGDAVGE